MAADDAAVPPAVAAERLRLRGQVDHRPAGVRAHAQPLLLGSDARLREPRLHRGGLGQGGCQPALQVVPSQRHGVRRRAQAVDHRRCHDETTSGQTSRKRRTADSRHLRTVAVRVLATVPTHVATVGGGGTDECHVCYLSSLS